MGRTGKAVSKALSTSVNTVKRVPVPAGVYTNSLKSARRSLPGNNVLRRHAVDVEMINRTRCVWLDKHRSDQGIIVYLHGGAFVSGPFAGDWDWLSLQADARQCAALLIDYRYAPDHQHPVALEDTLAVLETLQLNTKEWVLAGHNAGGGLAISACLKLAEAAQALPAALILMTPWTDLEMSNTLMAETDSTDPVHERRAHEAGAVAYAGRTPLDDPELSPHSAHLGSLPPVQLSVGTKDLLVTDVRVLKIQMEESGVQVEYREIGGRLSLFPLLRKGPDMKRLQELQQKYIAAALA